ncbi:MAG: helix-turn-helix domain-containing protein [Deltaproteobacteria bacterium]|nr:helix-turn-helix domain-containing protein [Deltaproteobacteria bacterium]
MPLFSGMSKANFRDLADTAAVRRFPLHVPLFTEGTLPEFLHIVIEGSVEIFGTHDGHETTIDIMQPVTAFILAEAMRDAVYLKSARTLTPSQIVMIPAKSMRDVFGRDAAFARAVVNELAERYRCIVRSLKNVKLRCSVERLANWILQTNAQQGHRCCIELMFDKRTLASSLGMTPENLSRNLALLAKYGVKSSGREIVIENPNALALFAKPNALIDG